MPGVQAVVDGRQYMWNAPLMREKGIDIEGLESRITEPEDQEDRYAHGGGGQTGRNFSCCGYSKGKPPEAIADRQNMGIEA